MNVVLSIEQAEVVVDPGGTAQTTVRIVNPGNIVEGFNLEIVGEASRWAQVLPATVNLYKGSETTVTVLFQPPAGPSTPAGPYTYGVKAVSLREGVDSQVEEAVVVVGSQVRLTGELRPSTRTSFRRGSFRLTVTSQGNSAARVRVQATDTAELLQVAVEPVVLALAPGATATAGIRASTKFNISSAERRHQLQVTYRQLNDDEPDWAPASAGPQPSAAGGVTPPEVLAQATLVQRKLFGRPVQLVASLSALAALVFGGLRVWNRPPKTPTNLTATKDPTTNVAKLTWDPVKRVADYRINVFQGCYAGAPALKPIIHNESRSDVASADLKDLEAGQYWFTVQSLSSRKVPSKASNNTRSTNTSGDIVCITIDGPATITPPTGVIATLSQDGKQADVSWQHPSSDTLAFRIVVNGAKAKEVERGSTAAVVEVAGATGLDRTRISVVAIDQTVKGVVQESLPAKAELSQAASLVVVVAGQGESDVGPVAARKFFEAQGRALQNYKVRKSGKIVVGLPQFVATPAAGQKQCTDLGWPLERCSTLPLSELEIVS